MTAYCSEPHPIEIDVHCNRPEGNHENHSAYSPTAESYVDWPNEYYVEPPQVAEKRSQSERKARLRSIATRTRGNA